MVEENKNQEEKENGKVEEKKEKKREEKEGKINEKTEEELIEERKKKLVEFFKKTNLWVLGFLIIALILGVYIRAQPMLDHGGKPGLWDIATNDWTLGPDLDPWLFARYAKTIVEQGSLPEIDTMRNVPLGFDTSTEMQFLSYMIVGTYYLLSIFNLETNIWFTSALFPVIMFALTILTFFLFVREIFIGKDKGRTNANIIALISTFVMIVIPTFLSRTVAGIPEKESVAFFFMFLAFYLFLRAWKSENFKIAVVLGILSGIATALMGSVWGGVSYVFVTIAISSLVAFILNKVHKKELIVYALWILFSFLIIILLPGKFSLMGLISSLDTGLAFLVFFIFLVHFILWNTRLKEMKILEKSKIPKNIISFIIAIVLGILLIVVFFGFGFIIIKLRALNQMFIKPITGRWSITVAENRQPYFTEWGASFGPFIKNIPVLFWLFFIGSIVLFKDMLKDIRKKDSWILTVLYVFFFFGLVFSRYSGSSIFNGENFISKLFYFGSALLLIGTLVYFYMKYHKENNKGFEEIDFEYLLLFSLFALCLFTARSAVRLIMVLAPIAPIFLSYLIVFSIDRFKKAKDETGKIVIGALMVLILLLSFFIFLGNPITKTPGFYQEIKSQAYSFIPSYYNQQWQKAMQWVRENTTEEAVFAHWWDYGYWIQSIGNRATVTDGGNAIAWWNYLTGRFVLTGDNEKDALEFLYNHNTTHLLIDSTDIGKYTAYSSIGSNENYDRYSWIPIMISDEKQIQETKNGTTRTYQGASAIDEDITYEKEGKEIFLPGQRAAIVGVILEMSKDGNSSFKQPEAIFYYQGMQQKIPVRYLYFNKQFFDFKTGLNATVYIMQRVYQTNQGTRIDNTGALMYLSPRLMRGLMAQIYLLNDPFNKFPHFKLAHSESSLIIDSLNSQGANLNEFVLFGDVQGPIKIWNITYTGEEKIKEEYLDIDASKYINWSL